jgi:hypothetical protein
VNDINKLKAAIANLESEAEKVKEFSGVLSSVSEARNAIGETKDALMVNAMEAKKFLNDSQASFNQLNTRLASSEERLGKIEQNQIQLRELITSLDILSPEDLAKLKSEMGLVVSESIASLKRHIEVVADKSQEKLTSKIKLIVVISVGSVIGIGTLYMKLVMGW